jgi:hypothetical protein
VNGRVGHLLGAFEPEDDGLHRFAQIYMLDNEAAVETRVNQNLNRRDTRIGWTDRTLKNCKRSLPRTIITLACTRQRTSAFSRILMPLFYVFDK